MIRVETTGLYHYEVAGENETAAAAELSRHLDLISRDYRHSETYIREEIAQLRQDIIDKYDVHITAVPG